MTENLGVTRLGVAGTTMCRLAELRRRQGRLDEAKALFDRAEQHHLSLLGRAAIAFDEGDFEAVPGLIEHYLRRSSDEDRADRAIAASLLVRAQLALGQAADIETAMKGLDAAAAMTGTPAIRATASLTRGHLELNSTGPAAAQCWFEDALDGFQKAGGPYEASLARLDLAAVLRDLGRLGPARREARIAFETLRELGAKRAAGRALDLVRSLDEGAPVVAVDGLGLSRREVEVVSLIAAGRSNQEIAAELVLSIRTVERHISSIYEKLDLHGGAARAAATAFALNHGLVTK